MKLNELAPVLASRPGRIQDAILYDRSVDIDLLDAPVDYIINNWPDFNVENIQADRDKIVICGRRS